MACHDRTHTEVVEARDYADHLVPKLDDDYGKLIRDRGTQHLARRRARRARELAGAIGYVEPHLLTGVLYALGLRRGACRSPPIRC
jgi:hypothetical protein